jgi:hypothetical protein
MAAFLQASKLEPRIMRYELADDEWAAIMPMLPNKPLDVPIALASFKTASRRLWPVTIQAL